MIRFTRHFDKSLLKIDFPALKHWDIKAEQHVNSWIFPHDSDVMLEVEDFDIDFECDFTLDENGYLDPRVSSVDINFGETFLYHENKFIGFLMHQLITFGIVVVQNSVYWLGGYIFSNMFGPLLDKILDDYKLRLELPSPFLG